MGPNRSLQLILVVVVAAAVQEAMEGISSYAIRDHTCQVRTTLMVGVVGGAAQAEKVLMWVGVVIRVPMVRTATRDRSTKGPDDPSVACEEGAARV